MTMRADSRTIAGLLAFLVPVALLLPFANKAFHIDDPLFLWMARHIAEHPSDPYGLNVFWGAQVTEPMYLANNNPPGIAYWLAATALFAGWSEMAMHFSMAVLAGAAGLGSYFLARDLCDRPLTATLIGVLTPGFLVSATTLMSDIPMTAFYVWSLALWVAGVKRNRPGLLQASAILMGIAVLMKYFAATLLPLTLVYTLVAAPKTWRWAWHYLTPLAIVGAYVAWGYWRYEINLFSLAAEIATSSRWRGERPQLLHVLTGVAFTGACGASLAVMTPFLWTRRVLGVVLVGGAALVAVICVPWVFTQIAGETPFTATYRFQVGLWIAAGMQIAILVVIDLWRRRDATAVLLACWIAGTFVFAVYINHMINARTLLPVLPALGILAARRMAALGEGVTLSPRWNVVSLSAAGLLSLWVAAADYEFANASRTVTGEFSRDRAKFSTQVYFYEHWGFQYYMEQAGARPLEGKLNAYNMESYRPMLSGDTLAVPHTNDMKAPNFDTYSAIATYAYPMRWHMKTMTDGAGFYSHYWGMLPFVAGEVKPETFLFIQVP